MKDILTAPFVEEMKTLCQAADLIVPNITEACFLTGMEYRETYDEAYIEDLLKALADGGNEDVVLTGVGYRPGMTGVLVREHGETAYYEHRRIEPGCHGTGDVYASALTGGILRGMSTFEAAKLAADYTVESIKKTRDDPSHWYGVKFEKAMPYLIQQLQFRAR